LLAVDAGTHLAAVVRILERYVTNSHLENHPAPVTLTSGPFEGLQLPCMTVNANAAHITRYLIDTYLITHPHLDHISGFVINTAGLPSARPKRLAALPSTISAFKAHIFNNVIWPNLSDENNGVGLVTYMRLVDGGSPALGDGDGKGYVEICEGLSVKALSISHGHCMENHSHRGSGSGIYPYEYSPENDRSLQRSNSYSVNNGKVPVSPGGYGRKPGQERMCVYDSSAYFIRDIATGHEVLIFGDVEPDTISLSPRNLQVWTDAAPKIASGLLTAVFIECSYSDSQHDDQLYGHLAPRYLIEELRALATCVEASRLDDADKKRRKRKRPSSAHAPEQSPRRSPRVSTAGQPSSDAIRSRRLRLESSSTTNVRSLDLDGPVSDSPISPTSHPLADRSLSVSENTHMADATHASQLPLKGLKIHIIHVKDTLEDIEPAGETILRQMRTYEKEEKLGCEFVLTSPGMSVYL
jgi:cAMP phosphodiesterase